MWVDDEFLAKANYSQKKNETKIKIHIEEGGENIQQTLPELVIIKLISSSGGLGYEF